MNVGDYVMHTCGDVGYVEAVDGRFVDVRWQTPLNVPSCVVSCCAIETLMIVPTDVLPIDRSEEWMAESKAFCAAIRAAIEELDHE